MAKRKTATKSPTTMRCPDCDSTGHEKDMNGKFLRLEVGHREDQCLSPDIHGTTYHRDLFETTDFHYVLCERCGGAGRVRSPESLLTEILEKITSMRLG